jgi:hypothetical protein
MTIVVSESEANTKVFLCHKCSGLLSFVPGMTAPLHGCGCISGWIRDWQTPVTVTEAMLDQAVQSERNVIWANERGRPDEAQGWAKRLEQLKASLGL